MIRTRVGYAGGTTTSPTYQSIGDHTETLQVDYDPARVSYAQLLDVFWKAHDPTSRTWSRQYLAAVFYSTDEERRLAEATRDRRAQELGAKIGTEIRPLGTFTLAEDSHQKYYLRGQRELLLEIKGIYPSEADLVRSTAAARLNGYLAGHGTRQELAAEIDVLGLSPAGRTALVDRVERRAR